MSWEGKSVPFCWRVSRAPDFVFDELDEAIAFMKTGKSVGQLLVDVDDDRVEGLVDAMTHCPAVNNLCIWFSEVRQAAVLPLLQSLLTVINRVEGLEIGISDVHQDCKRDIIESIRQLLFAATHLQEIRLHGRLRCTFDADDFARISHFGLTHPRTMFKLTFSAFSGNELDNAANGTAISTLLEVQPALQELELISRPKTAEGLLRTFDCNVKIPALEVLTIHPFPPSIENAHSLGAFLFKGLLRCLDLTIENCDPKVISAIFHAVSIGKLERFDFKMLDPEVQNSIQIFDDFESFLLMSQTLKTLSLWYATIPKPMERRSLSSSLSDSLEYLKLRVDVQSGVSDQPFTLIQSIQQLKCLKIHGKFDSLNFVHQLTDFLRVNAVLEFLDISSLQIGSQGVVTLTGALLNNVSLTHLDLQQTGFEDEGMTLIAECLRVNTALTFLDLGGNKYTSEGLDELASSLKSNRHLLCLCLQSPNITASKSFVDTILGNSSLVLLEGSEDFEDLEFVCSNRRRFQEGVRMSLLFNVRDKKLSNRFASHLLEVIFTMAASMDL